MSLYIRYFLICLILLCIITLFQSFNRQTLAFSKQTEMLAYVVSFDDSIYQLWQAEVLLYNMQKLGLSNQLWFSILYDHEPSEAAKKLTQRHSNVRLFYNDFPNDWKRYKPICKSYGVAKLLKIMPSLGKCLFVMDADVMLTRPIPFTIEMLEDDCIYGSDTENYLSFKHFHNDKEVTLTQLTKLMEIICPLKKNQLLQDYRNGSSSNIGAQYLFKRVDAAFFHKVAMDSWSIYQYAMKLSLEGSQCQVWVMGDMMSFLLNSINTVGLQKVKTSPILNFSWATCPIGDKDKHPILHFAGVTAKDGQFDKQRYTTSPPWSHTNFDYITHPTTLAQFWLENIQEYSMREYGIRMITPC